MAVRYWLIGTLTIGDFILLRSYLSNLTENVRQMGQDIRRIYEAMADANEMTEILLTAHEVVDDEHATELTVPKGTVEFRNVKFSYVGSAHPILQDFNLKIGAGQRVGIVGPSGGGKSTILKLLVRLHDVHDGAILVDHQDIALVTQSSSTPEHRLCPSGPDPFPSHVDGEHPVFEARRER